MALGILLGNPKRELKTYSFWRDLANEFAGTAMLLFFAQSCASLLSPEDQVPLLQQALNNGLTLFVYVEATGPFGGCHINTSITVLFLLTKQIPLHKAIGYAIMQSLGACAGAGLVYLITNDHGRDNMAPINLAEGVGQFQGVVCEAVITLNMCVVTLGAADAKRQPRFLTALAIGISVALGIIAGGKITGGSMNPVIPFGPAVITGKWDNHWVYWVGPFAGATLGALMYNMFTLADRLDRGKQEYDVSNKKKANGVNMAEKASNDNAYLNDTMSTVCTDSGSVNSSMSNPI